MPHRIIKQFFNTTLDFGIFGASLSFPIGKWVLDLSFTEMGALITGTAAILIAIGRLFNLLGESRIKRATAERMEKENDELICYNASACDEQAEKVEQKTKY